MKKSSLVRSALAISALATVVISVPAHAAGVDAKAAALVPAAVAKSGVLLVGVDATYPPNENKDANGNVIGWDPELVTAIGSKLGLKVKYVISSFDNIIPKIKGGTLNIGMSSFTDNKQREAQVDFVDYFNAGTQWASLKGKPVDPNNACGLHIAAQATTTEVADLQAKSAACTKAGKKAIQILQYDTQGQANTAVLLGKANALSADSPVTENAVSATGGKLQLDGAIYGSAPYGLAITKGSKLVNAVDMAIQDLYADGTYASILKKWGVSAGAVSTFGINGAIN
jgi:polar amino acid transport system substrate-binding protein